MNAVPTAYVEFGQTLAFTERTLTAVLRRHLAQRGVEPETWFALKLIAQGGPEADRAAVLADLAASRGLDATIAGALLVRLTGEGWVAGAGDTVGLTPEGTAVFGDLREHVLGATANLLDHVELADIETMVRTLKAIIRLAQEEEAASAA
jgi:DNA-binding MarR family transcriptional regulator